MMKRDFGVGVAFVTALVILLAVNLAATVVLRNVKLDLTDGNLYTLSKGTRSMLKKLDDKVDVKLYYSKRPASGAPAIKQYADRVIEMLKQFAGSGGGKMTFEVINPRPDTEEEEAALKYGLQGVPTQSETLYFGIVARSETGTEKTIPFLDPNREEFLEYDLAVLVSGVSQTDRKTIGVMSALDVMGSGDDPMARMQGQPRAEPWAFVSELRRSYNVKEVGATVGEIEKDVDLLLVIHPKKLPEQTEYAIDQYVLKGGKALILVDGECEHEIRTTRVPPQSRFQETFDSSLPTLFPAWGIEMSKGKVIADPAIAAKVNLGNGAPMEYIVFLMLRAQNCNQEEIVSSNLEQLLVATAGPLKKKADAKYEITPLLESGIQAMEMDSFRIRIMTMASNPDLDQLKRDYVAGNEKLGIAYKITGKFASAFPNGKPPSLLPKDPDAANPDSDKEKKEAEDPLKDHIATADKDCTVIVVSDVDFITDDIAISRQNFFGQTLIQPRGDNLNFMNNAIEQLAGSDDLIGLRTRGKSARSFTTVDAIEKQAEQRWKSERDSLQKSYDDTVLKISQIQRGQAQEGQKAVLSGSQMEQIQQFQKESAEIKKRLRSVKRNLRQEIESLGARLKFINIALIPCLVILFSFAPPAWRAYRMRSNRE